MGKQNEAYTFDGLKGKEILTCATTWMNLENIMISEISWLQKNNVLFHIYEV